MIFANILHISQSINVLFEQRNQGEARFHGSRHVFEEFSGNAEPHRSQAHGDVVRAVQGDCGVHAPGVAAFARQCGPD